LDGPPVVDGWRSLDSVNIHDIARSGHEKTPHSTLELSKLFSTLSTGNTAAFHPVLKSHLFRDAWRRLGLASALP
jgi:hypothetical protein